IRWNARLCRATAGPEHEETILLERESNRATETRSGTGDEGHSLLPGFPGIPRRQATFNVAAWIDLSAHSFYSRGPTAMTASRIHTWFCGPRIDAIPADAVSALSPMLMRIFYPLPDVVSDVTAALPRATCRCQTTKAGAPTSSSAITPRNGADGVPTPTME